METLNRQQHVYRDIFEKISEKKAKSIILGIGLPYGIYLDAVKFHSVDENGLDTTYSLLGWTLPKKMARHANLESIEKWNEERCSRKLYRCMFIEGRDSANPYKREFVNFLAREHDKHRKALKKMMELASSNLEIIYPNFDSCTSCLPLVSKGTSIYELLVKTDLSCSIDEEEKEKND